MSRLVFVEKLYEKIKHATALFVLRMNCFFSGNLSFQGAGFSYEL